LSIKIKFFKKRITGLESEVKREPGVVQEDVSVEETSYPVEKRAG
jgi:hypothetical protein